jgi:hypothetical protein
VGRLGKATVIQLVAIAVVMAALAAAYLFSRQTGRSEREAFIYHCNETGAGGMFTSREYCEELYRRSKGRGAPQNSN